MAKKGLSIVTETDFGGSAVNTKDSFEDADEALRGAIAIQVVVSGDGEEYSDFINDGLLGAQRVLLAVARENLAALRQECWTANALLGNYGEDAKARASGGIDKFRSAA
jgi:hypothetical protein